MLSQRSKQMLTGCSNQGGLGRSAWAILLISKLMESKSCLIRRANGGINVFPPLANRSLYVGWKTVLYAGFDLFDKRAANCKDNFFWCVMEVHWPLHRGSRLVRCGTHPSTIVSLDLERTRDLYKRKRTFLSAPQSVLATTHTKLRALVHLVLRYLMWGKEVSFESNTDHKNLFP